LHLLDNKIGDESKGPSVQQDISILNNLECSMDISTKSSEVVVRIKISMV
jgi:hypothetical protein